MLSVEIKHRVKQRKELKTKLTDYKLVNQKNLLSFLINQSNNLIEELTNQVKQIENKSIF